MQQVNEKFSETFLPFDKELIIERPKNWTIEGYKNHRRDQCKRLKARVKYGFIKYLASELITTKATGVETTRKRTYSPYKRPVKILS